MERVVEWFVAVTAAVVGLSHLLRPGDWAEAYRQLHRCGRPGAFAKGAAPGARRGYGRRARVVGVAGGGADGAGVAAGRQGVGVLSGTGPGAAVDGAGRPLAARLRRGGPAVVDSRRVGMLLPVAPGG